MNESREIRPPGDAERGTIDAWWRAANYLSLGLDEERILFERARGVSDETG